MFIKEEVFVRKCLGCQGEFSTKARMGRRCPDCARVRKLEKSNAFSRERGEARKLARQAGILPETRGRKRGEAFVRAGRAGRAGR